MTKRSQVQRTVLSTWRTTCLVPQIDLTLALHASARTKPDESLQMLARQLLGAFQRYGLVFVDDSQLPAPSARAPFRRCMKTGLLVCRLLEFALTLDVGTLTAALEHVPCRRSRWKACETWPRTAYSRGMIISDWEEDPGLLVVGSDLFRADSSDNPLEPVTALIAGTDKRPQRVSIPSGFTLVRTGRRLAEKTHGRIPACRSALIVTEGLEAHYLQADQRQTTLVQTASAVSLGEEVVRRSHSGPVSTSISPQAKHRAA